MLQRLLERLDLALRFLDLLVELVALPLQLLALLRRLDHIVRLRVLAVAAVAELAADDVVLAREPLHLDELVRELARRSVPLLLGGLELRAEHVRVHLWGRDRAPG